MSDSRMQRHKANVEHVLEDLRKNPDQGRQMREEFGQYLEEVARIAGVDPTVDYEEYKSAAKNLRTDQILELIKLYSHFRWNNTHSAISNFIGMSRAPYPGLPLFDAYEHELDSGSCSDYQILRAIKTSHPIGAKEWLERRLANPKPNDELAGLVEAASKHCEQTLVRHYAKKYFLDDPYFIADVLGFIGLPEDVPFLQGMLDRHGSTMRGDDRGEVKRSIKRILSKAETRARRAAKQAGKP